VVLPERRPVVLVAEELAPSALEVLSADFELRHVDGADRSALLPALAGVDAVLIRSATKIDAEALAGRRPAQGRRPGRHRAGQRRRGRRDRRGRHGRQRADLQHRQRRRARDRAAARGGPQRAGANSSLQSGEWKRSRFTGVELADKTVGVVGLGRIGVLVAQRLSAFGVRLLAYDPYVQPARAAQIGVRLVGLDELLGAERLRHHPPAQDAGDGRA
jgi:D-3-phosphoglycerate dehydrogenase